MKIGVFLFYYFYRHVCGKSEREVPCEELPEATKKVLQYVENLGVECIEIVNMATMMIETIVPCLKKRGNIELIIHQAGGCRAADFQNISSRNAQVRKVAAENLKLLIDIAGEVGARAIVLHGPVFDNSIFKETINGGFGSEDILPFKDVWRHCIELLKECSERAYRRGVILAVEDLELKAQGWKHGEITETPAKLAELIDELDSKGLQCTFDVGHANLKRPQAISPIEYARILGKRIAHVHLHDCDGIQDHIPLGDGNIDFENLMKLFTEIEEQREDEISITLETFINIAGLMEYEREWEKLKKLKASCS